MGELKLFCGNANPSLAKSVAKLLKVKLGKAMVGRFPDEEIEIKVLDVNSRYNR